MLDSCTLTDFPHSPDSEAPVVLSGSGYGTGATESDCPRAATALRPARYPKVSPGPSVAPLAGDASPNSCAVTLPAAYRPGTGFRPPFRTWPDASTFGPPVVPEQPRRRAWRGRDPALAARGSSRCQPCWCLPRSVKPILAPAELRVLADGRRLVERCSVRSNTPGWAPASTASSAGVDAVSQCGGASGRSRSTPAGRRRETPDRPQARRGGGVGPGRPARARSPGTGRSRWRIGGPGYR